MRRIFTIILLGLIILFTQTTKTFAEEKQSATSATLSNTLISTRVEDKRGKILREFLELRNSPLAQHAEDFVQAADENNIDWKMVAAISGVESTFGQAVPYNCNNAWGYGIYGTNMRCFSSYKEAISVISKALREDYMNKWKASNVWEIGHLYAASPTWAVRVDGFMNNIDTFAQAQAIETPTPTISL